MEEARIYGFTAEAVKVMGKIRLPVTLGEGSLSVTQMVEFMVLDQESAHNTLVGRELLKAMKVVTYIHHLTIKFSTPNVIGSVRGT